MTFQLRTRPTIHRARVSMGFIYLKDLHDPADLWDLSSWELWGSLAFANVANSSPLMRQVRCGKCCGHRESACSIVASECIRMHQKYRSMSNPNNIGTCNNVSIGFMHTHAQFGMNLDHSKDNWDQLGIFQDVFLEIAWREENASTDSKWF